MSHKVTIHMTNGTTNRPVMTMAAHRSMRSTSRSLVFGGSTTHRLVRGGNSPLGGQQDRRAVGLIAAGAAVTCVSPGTCVIAQELHRNCTEIAHDVGTGRTGVCDTPWMFTQLGAHPGRVGGRCGRARVARRHPARTSRAASTTSVNDVRD